MNEVEDVQPGHIYQPGNKKEVRLVYRILSGPYCGRHQKSFSLTKWGPTGAWAAAREAKAFMLDTGRLPPYFASPYSRSRLTNASANGVHCRDTASADTGSSCQTPSSTPEEEASRGGGGTSLTSASRRGGSVRGNGALSAPSRCMDSDEAFGASVASPSLSTRASPLSLPRLAPGASPTGIGIGRRGGGSDRQTNRRGTASSKASSSSALHHLHQQVPSSSEPPPPLSGQLSDLGASRPSHARREPLPASLRTQQEAFSSSAFSVHEAARKFLAGGEDAPPPTALELASLSLLASMQGRRETSWASVPQRQSFDGETSSSFFGVSDAASNICNTTIPTPESAAGDGASFARPALLLLQHMARMSPQASAALLKLLEIPSDCPSKTEGLGSSACGFSETHQEVSAAPSSYSFSSSSSSSSCAPSRFSHVARGRDGRFEASRVEAFEARGFGGRKTTASDGMSSSPCELSQEGQPQTSTSAEERESLLLDRLLHQQATSTLASQAPSSASHAVTPDSSLPLSWGASAVGETSNLSLEAGSRSVCSPDVGKSLLCSSLSQSKGVSSFSCESKADAASQAAASCLVSQSLFSALASLADAIELERHSRRRSSFSLFNEEKGNSASTQTAASSSLARLGGASGGEEEARRKSLGLHDVIPDSLLKLLRSSSPSPCLDVSSVVQSGGSSVVSGVSLEEASLLSTTAKEETSFSSSSSSGARVSKAMDSQTSTLSNACGAPSASPPSAVEDGASGGLLAASFATSRTRSTTQTSGGGGGWRGEGVGTESEGEMPYSSGEDSSSSTPLGQEGPLPEHESHIEQTAASTQTLKKSPCQNQQQPCRDQDRITSGYREVEQEEGAGLLAERVMTPSSSDSPHSTSLAGGAKRLAYHSKDNTVVDCLEEEGELRVIRRKRARPGMCGEAVVEEDEMRSKREREDLKSYDDDAGS